MKLSLFTMVAYAVGIVLLTGAWHVAIPFLTVALLLHGMAKLFVVFLPRYHAYLIWKITEAEVRLKELNREQIS